MFKTQNLYQNDEKWKDVRLGNSTETIGGWGCLLTSVAMMLNGLGNNETPVTVNDKMRQAGGFLNGSLLIPSYLPRAWPTCSFRGVQDCSGYRAPIADIDAAIAAGKPVILQVDWNKQEGVQTHFVLVKEKRGNDYVIYDPYKYGGDSPDKDVLLTSRYKHNGARLETEISAVLWFDAVQSGAAEPPKMEKVALPAEKYILYTLEDDLALRAEPALGAYLLKRLMKNTELTSLEAKAAARSKLGASGQWLRVQDPEGDQGYVAAWYVGDAKGQPVATAVIQPAGTSAPAAGQLPKGALALVPTEEIAFRTQPVVSPETVIRRIPVTEQLVCLEPASQAIPKVGVTGQWLRVRDANNKAGYVAAWFVRYASGATALAQTGGMTSAPASSNGAPLKVRATAEGVALRRQPVVNDSTLIKRLALGTELLVLEPNAETKIGRNDQWLSVKDPTGTEGVVAAWFVGR